MKDRTTQLTMSSVSSLHTDHEVSEEVDEAAVEIEGEEDPTEEMS